MAEKDLISRQAAIEAFLTELTKRERKNLLHTWSTVEVKYFITKMLEQMPSAQPEIVRCGQCKYAEVADKEDAQDGYTCQFHRGSIWFSGSYCSWAERRTDG